MNLPRAIVIDTEQPDVVRAIHVTRITDLHQDIILITNQDWDDDTGITIRLNAEKARELGQWLIGQAEAMDCAITLNASRISEITPDEDN